MNLKSGLNQKIKEAQKQSPYSLSRKYHDDLKSNEYQSCKGQRQIYDCKQNFVSNIRPLKEIDQTSNKKSAIKFQNNLTHEKRSKKYAYIKSRQFSIYSKLPQTDQQQIKKSYAQQNLQDQTNLNAFCDQGQYTPFQTKKSFVKKYQKNTSWTKDEQIKLLKESLDQERKKFQQFQQETIKNQIKILQTINELELKLKQLKSQNSSLLKENQSLKRKLWGHDQEQLHQLKFIDPVQANDSFNPKYNSNDKLNQEIRKLNQKLNVQSFQLDSLQRQYKKTKGMAGGLIDMMKKVDNIKIPQNQDKVKFAWKWIKKVVWEYEAIRKKAFEWKRAYDELNRDSENEQQNCQS